LSGTFSIKTLRTTPGGGKRGVIISSLLIALSAPPVHADEQEDKYNLELQALRSEIGQLSRELDRQVTSRDRERGDLARIEKQAVELERNLQLTRVERQEQEAMVADIESQVLDETARQASHRESLAELVYATYVMGERSYLKMLLNQENPYSLGRTLNYYRYISGARGAELKDIREQLNNLTALQQEKQELNASMLNLESRYRDQIIELQQARVARDVALVNVQEKINSTDARLTLLKENQERLSRLTGNLARYTSRIRSGRVEPGGLGNQRGQLKLPVAGSLRQEFGGTVAGSGMVSNGIFIDTEDAADVHSVFRGQVIFADWLRGFGLLVIVDHGEGYMSLYGHNKVLYKQIGEAVETGEVIAESGTTGGLTSPGVYFEIRQEGKPRNPMLWCRL
jgi:septal ring factor EnvC (AmiA/AmiB activator)